MEKLLESFITLFVIMDPIGNLPVFISMVKGMPLAEIRKNINKSMFVAGLLLFVFLFFGLEIFRFFGININSFQIAGGILLLILGITYVLGVSGKFVKTEGNDLSIPLGTPLLTGPGVITTTIILVKEHGPYITSIAALLTLFASWLILMNAPRIYKLLGEHWTRVVSRVMGIILAAIAVELISEGVLNIIAPLL